MRGSIRKRTQGRSRVATVDMMVPIILLNVSIWKGAIMHFLYAACCIASMPSLHTGPHSCMIYYRFCTLNFVWLQGCVDEGKDPMVDRRPGSCHCGNRYSWM